MAQLMPLPLNVSCLSKIQIGFTFLVPGHPGSPGQRAIKWVGVGVCLKRNIDDYFYLRDIQTCFCCDEILRGGERRCPDRKEVVDVSEFECPYLIRCKKCANERLAQPRKCEICSIEVIKSCASTGLLDTTFTTMISEASCHLH